MATIKSYTDLSQSKKLAEILPLESADMTYYACVKDWKGNPVPPKWNKPVVLTKEELALPCSSFQEYKYIPCWSLAALLAFLPNSAFLERGSATELYRVTLPVELEASDWYIEPLDACYEMIIRLNKLKML